MSNPWKDIPLSDYESHMKTETVMQLQAMNEMMRDQFNAAPAGSVMILGIAGGNGLEHVDLNKTEKVYGIDINQNYLNECLNRYGILNGVLECLCIDICDENAGLPHADMLIANLFIEYVGYECFRKAAEKIKPEYISCIIQINKTESFVSDSDYGHIFDGLGQIHHNVSPTGLIAALSRINYSVVNSFEKALPDNKKLMQIDFVLQN